MSKFCAKCGSEIPEESKFCLKCGKKVENSKSKEKEFYKNKKSIIIAGSVLAIIIMIIAVVVVNNGTTRYAKKMKNYLEKVGYNCDGVYKYDDGSLDTDGFYFYCQMTTPNGVYKEVSIRKNENSAFAVSYKETVNGAYSISIQGQDYASQRSTGDIRYYDEIENHTFHYFASHGVGFDIGDQVNCDKELNQYKDACEDDAKDVNAAMREFESYFSGAGLKLK